VDLEAHVTPPGGPGRGPASGSQWRRACLRSG
jgi:hypothetical protein